jgi:hypothetical protein
MLFVLYLLINFELCLILSSQTFHKTIIELPVSMKGGTN